MSALDFLPTSETRLDPLLSPETSGHTTNALDANELDAAPERCGSTSHYQIDVHALMRGIVHELRNPLAAVLTAASLLRDGSGDAEESAMLLGVVQKESHRMNRILTEFAQFATPHTPSPIAFDLALTLRETLRELEETGGSWPAGVRVENEIEGPLPVLADPFQIGQAVRNVLENALEALNASSQSGTLRLVAQRRAGCAVVHIENDGELLSPDAAAKAFQPFYSTKPAATGLGLSIALMSLRASGGDARLEAITPQLATPQLATDNPTSAPQRGEQGTSDEHEGPGEQATIKSAPSSGVRVIIELPLANE